MSNPKSFSIPMCSSKKLTKEDGSDLFDQPIFYRSTVGTLQYLTLSRPDKPSQLIG